MKTEVFRCKSFENTDTLFSNTEALFGQTDMVYCFFSKHRPSGPMLSISQNVRLCVCPSVCSCVCSILRYLQGLQVKTKTKAKKNDL